MIFKYLSRIRSHNDITTILRFTVREKLAKVMVILILFNFLTEQKIKSGRYISRETKIGNISEHFHYPLKITFKTVRWNPL